MVSVPGPSGLVGREDDLTLPMVVMGWMVLALLLFLFRPSSLRGPRPTGKPPSPHHVSIDYTLTYRAVTLFKIMAPPLSTRTINSYFVTKICLARY